MSDLFDRIGKAGDAISADDVEGWGYAGETVPWGFDKILKQTERAILVADSDGELWIPKSVIAAIEDKGVDVAEWWARREGMI